MRKILALLLILAILNFAFNVTYSVKENEIVFIIDGTHYEKMNLTLFLFKNGVQVRGLQKNNVILPHYYFMPYNESGVYELRAVSQKNEYANAIVNITIPDAIKEAEKREEQQSSDYAIIVAVAGLLVLGLLLRSFLKAGSYKK